MRVVFCGSGGFATPSLHGILASRHQVVQVITQPPRPAGRGGRLHPTSISLAAQAAGLPTLECPKINADDVVALIRGRKPDVIAVVDFGQMVRKAARDSAPLGAFNLHGSLLPELRGAAPVNWAIIRGYKTTGVTTFSLVDEMDAGAMYLQASVPVEPQETAEELRIRLAQVGAKTMVQTLDLLEVNQAAAVEQDHSKATLAPRLKKEDGLIDWSADAETIRNLIHGTWPWPGGHTVFTHREGKATAVTIARAAAESGDGGRGGTLDSQLLVAAGKGRLRILEIKPAGGRLMPWRDFVNGYRAGAGDIFIRPGT